MPTGRSASRWAGIAALAVLAIALVIALFANTRTEQAAAFVATESTFDLPGPEPTSPPDTLTPTVTGTRPTETVTSTPTRTPTVPPCGPAWRLASYPNTESDHKFLLSVAAVSSSDVWAVGYYFGSDFLYHALIMHWDGTQWTNVPTASLGESLLNSVAAVGANDVWAVGSDPILGTKTLHWNGTQWSIVPSPNPSSYYGILQAVSGSSANDVWAVGYYYDDTASQTLTLHWNGTQWSIIPSLSPSASSNYLSAVAAIAPNDVWAVGEYYDSNNLQSLALIEHWDGLGWSITAGPSMQGGGLTGIVALATDDVWAVGYGDNSNGYAVTLVIHWNGTQWSAVPSPNPAGAWSSFLYAVDAASEDDLWAVGLYHDGNINRTLTEHWDGTQWHIVASPNSYSYDNYLGGVATSPHDVWATGYYFDNENDEQSTILERYNDPCAGSAMAGHVIWQGPPAQPNPRQQLPITLTLKLGTSEIDYSGVTDAGGVFTVTVGGLVTGTYDWRAKGPRYLANAGSVELSGSPLTSVEMGLMKVGDANDDNLVTILDFNILKLTYGLSSGQEGYDERADFTNDDLVNIVDFSFLKVNYGRSGAPPIRP